MKRRVKSAMSKRQPEERERGRELSEGSEEASGGKKERKERRARMRGDVSSGILIKPYTISIRNSSRPQS